MEMMDIFNDVLTTERRRSQEFGSEKSEIESDNALNFSKMSFYINPTYSAGQDAKPYTVSSKYIHKKKQRERKSTHSIELTELLALAEIRFLSNVEQLKQAIVVNKKIYLLRIVNFVIKITPIIEILQKMIKKTYWYK